MADKNRYPQIPSTVWWGIRSILQRTPNALVDERFLGIELGVQEAAARQYLAELKNVGILTEEGKATPLALKWRLDATYHEAVEELAAAVFPQGLLHVAPPGEAERQKVINWFLQEGLGQGTASNKAATYILLTNPGPNESPNKSAASQPARDRPRRTMSRTRSGSTVRQPANSELDVRSVPLRREEKRPAPAEGFPLHVNVQIHISADAGSEQIESIFSAMRRYLYDTSGA